jgi:glycine/D-amino acid oxidase-like deaminating enzyme/nitrite reductase/ring-hydroxylating ferredoxin subunit
MTDRLLWSLEADDRHWPALAGDAEIDVAIVGGGIVGLSTAHFLGGSGLRVAVLEARRIGYGATARSTAKATSQHGLRYRGLVSDLGEEAARLYGHSNEEALRWIVDRAGERDDLLRRTSAFVYAADAETADELREEAQVAVRLGLPADFVPELELPFGTHGALRFSDQAAMNPCLFLRALAADLPGGVGVHEKSRVVEVEHGEPCLVRTGAHRIRARWVVVATQMPVTGEGKFFAKAFPHAHPVVAAGVAPDAVPDGMFISARPPIRSFRPARVGGADYVVTTGPTFKPGESGAEAEAFKELEDWLAATFRLGAKRFRWTNEDFRPMDGLPFIGAASGDSPHLLVATGFDAWGITTGVMAGRMLAETIQGRSHPLSSHLDASRLRPIKGGATFVSENVRSGAAMVRDRVIGAKDRKLGDIGPGDGGIVRHEGQRVAVSRAASGDLTAVSAICTHLGCVVGWNAVDRTWDCPCHGSRFAASGEVLSGPAVSPLEPVDLDAAAAAEPPG